MSPRKTVVFAASAAAILAGCVSTATGILDSVAGGIADIGTGAILSANQQECENPSTLARQAIRAEITEDRAFNSVNSQCSRKFDIALDRASFSNDYRAGLEGECLPDRAAVSSSSVCDAVPKFVAARAAFLERQERARNTTGDPYRFPPKEITASLETFSCDHKLFRSKPNVAPESKAVLAPGSRRCSGPSCGTRSAHWLFDGQRGSFEGAKTNWASDPKVSENGEGGWVELRFPFAYDDLQQVALFSNRISQPTSYRITVLTDDGWKQLVERECNEELLICHRFEPQTVSAIRVWGRDVQFDSQLRLTEIVVR
ncbi:MAG: hypothetical protein AAGK01_05085 [Pseudomonadota bacterium]